MEHHKKTIDTYNKIAQEYSDSHYDHFWKKEFEIFDGMVGGGSVIDIGCGAGRDAEHFIKNDYEYTGVDASSEMLSVAKQRVTDGIFLPMNFNHLEFEDKTFDSFWASASFLHVPKAEVGQALKEAHRVLKDQGVGFISVKEKIDFDEGLIHQDMYGGVERYFSFYDEDEFRGILESNNFKVEHVDKRVEDDKNHTVWMCFFVKKR